MRSDFVVAPKNPFLLPNVRHLFPAGLLTHVLTKNLSVINAISHRGNRPSDLFFKSCKFRWVRLQYASVDLILYGTPMDGWHVRCWCGLREVENAGEASLFFLLISLKL